MTAWVPSTRLTLALLPGSLKVKAISHLVWHKPGVVCLDARVQHKHRLRQQPSSTSKKYHQLNMLTSHQQNNNARSLSPLARRAPSARRVLQHCWPHGNCTNSKTNNETQTNTDHTKRKWSPVNARLTALAPPLIPIEVLHDLCLECARCVLEVGTLGR